MTCRVLVTGATGFLGGHLTKALVGRGDEVRALVRTPSKLAIAGVTPIAADLTIDSDALVRAVAGVDCVFHCAGAVGDKVTWERGRAINVEGTARIARTARKARVRRFVHVSTIGVYGVGAGTYDERSPRLKQNEPYTDSKIEAEQAAEAAFADDPGALRILRPAMIYGPDDTGMMPRLVEVLRKGTPMIGGGNGRVGLVHVSDVVASLLAAAEYDGPERVFDVLGPDDLTWAELVERVTSHFALPPPSRMPRSIAMMLGAVVEALSAVRLAPRPPPVSRFFVELLTAKREYSSVRTREALGVAPRVPVAEGVSHALADLSRAHSGA